MSKARGKDLGKSCMEKKVKEVKAAVSLIIEEDVLAIKQIIRTFTNKTSKDSFIEKRKRESIRQGKANRAK